MDGGRGTSRSTAIPVRRESAVSPAIAAPGATSLREVEAEAELRDAKERAEHAETLLRDAVDSISEGFVIYDHDDRLVHVQRGLSAASSGQRADLMIPGTRFETSLRQHAQRRQSRSRRPRSGMAGGTACGIAFRQRHSNSRWPMERWILVTDRRMNNGGIAGLRDQHHAAEAGAGGVARQRGPAGSRAGDRCHRQLGAGSGDRRYLWSKRTVPHPRPVAGRLRADPSTSCRPMCIPTIFRRSRVARRSDRRRATRTRAISAIFRAGRRGARAACRRPGGAGSRTASSAGSPAPCRTSPSAG